MRLRHKTVWRTPEEIVDIGFQRAAVIMMNEAHDGWKLCIRTRQIGRRILMGYQFKKLSGIYPFVIDQTRTLRFSDDKYRARLVQRFAQDLVAHDGTPGFLAEESPRMFGQDTDADGFLLSTQNELE